MQLYAAAAVADTAHSFHATVDVQRVVDGFIDDPSEALYTNNTTRYAAFVNAARDYANALKKGDHVPEETMKIMRSARDDILFNDEISERAEVKHLMMDELRDAGNGNIIHLPNAIPTFLLSSVTDKKADVHTMIDAMSLNPHIAEHMKHSFGHYYEDKEEKWDESAIKHIQDKLDAMAKEYKLLDDAVKEDADLTDVNYIVIPDVGRTDEAITSRTEKLDALFKANPHLTLVVAFADNVTAVGDYFCSTRNYTSTLSTHVKKLSFTGKHLHTVGQVFFYAARALTSVDFRGLSALQTVGYSFFSKALSLTSVDFKGLGALQNVGSGFFMNAKNLTSMHVLDDLSGALITSVYKGKARIIVDAQPAAEGAAATDGAADADG